MIMSAPAMAQPWTTFSPTPPQPKTAHVAAGSHLGGVDRRANAGHDATAEQCSLREPEQLYPRTPGAEQQAYAVHHEARSWEDPAGLALDAVRAEQRLAIVQDELAKMEQRYRLAQEELEAVSSGDSTRAAALRTRRFFVRRVPKERIRYVLGTLRARAMRR